MSKFLIASTLQYAHENSQLAKKFHLGFEYNDFYMPEVLEDTMQQKRIMESYQREGIPDYCTMHGAFLDVAVFSSDGKIREISELRMEQSMQIAQMIGAKGVVFHTNVNPFLVESRYKERVVTYTVAFLKKMLENYPNHNIYMENMFDNEPGILLEISQSLKEYPNYGVCLDYAHANISSTPLSYWVEQLHPYIRHIHINDNDGKHDLHLAVGEGEIDWEQFAVYHEKYFGECSILIETTLPERQRQSVEYLQRLGIMNGGTYGD